MSDSGPHLLHVFPSFEIGGSQVRAVQLMEMMPAGSRHSVLAMNGQTGCRAQVSSRVQVKILEPPPPRGFLATGRWVAGLLRQLRPDLLLTYNWGAIESVLGSRLAGVCPLVHHEDGFGPEESERYLRRRIWTRRLLLGAAAAVVVPSRRLESLARWRWKQPPGRLHYLPNGVDLVRFRPTPAKGLEAGQEPAVVVGHVGHFRPEKSQDWLLRAFAATKARRQGQAKLMLCGGGPRAGELEALVRELALEEQVSFTGVVKDTAPVYACFDVFALSSQTEQMPLTVLEAMASGLPVVSPDVGDVREMLHPQNRPFVVPRNDPTALATALDRLVEDRKLRLELGRLNRQHCEAQYEWSQCYGRYVDLYLGLIGG